MYLPEKNEIRSVLIISQHLTEKEGKKKENLINLIAKHQKYFDATIRLKDEAHLKKIIFYFL